MPPATDRIAVIVPAWNEAGAIGPAIAALPPGLAAMVVVVDGGSTDGTQAEAIAAGADVLAQQQRGYGAACAEGAAHAAARGATILLFMDGDGSDDAAGAARITGPIADRTADFVIATRIPVQAGALLWHQRAAGWLIGGLAGLSCGTRYRDMAPFRALRTETLHALGMTQMGFGWNLEMQMRAAAAGLRILQPRSPCRRRIAGQSKVAGNLSGTLRATWRILATLATLSRELRRTPSGGA